MSPPPVKTSSRARLYVLRAYYRLRPVIPRSLQIRARQVRARRIWANLHFTATAHMPDTPLVYSWPDSARACVTLTHDVETARGQENIPALLALEREAGVRSCWNFVIRRYRVDTDLFPLLRRAGHEIGLHGVFHDGRKFDSLERFRERLAIMEATAEKWGAAGFRSPSLIYDYGMLTTLPFRWDSSMPAYDPFQPRSGDCHRYLPFMLNRDCVELPVTVWQDFTLFDELALRDIAVWVAQIDALYDVGGLINIIVHPDYMRSAERQRFYRELLAHIRAKPAVWITTPSDVAEWHRSRTGRRFD